MDHRERTITEARAKVTWGEPLAAVLVHLRSNGIPPTEARQIADELFAERAAEVRRAGVRKMILGSVLILTPFVFWIICSLIGLIPLKVFGLTVVAGLYGIYKLIDGIQSVVAPKSDSSDLSQD